MHLAFLDTELFRAFWLSFIPLLVAMDAPGTLPLYIGMTDGLAQTERRSVLRQSIITAFLVAVGFMLIGRWIFDLLGILVEDFMIAGGVVLLVIAIADIVRAGERHAAPSPTLGVVPLGTPIIAGPAVLTATLVLQGTHGYFPVLLSLLVNLMIAWIIFALADRIIQIAGINGARAFAKVASLILAAFAVMLIRSGLFKLIGR